MHDNRTLKYVATEAGMLRNEQTLNRAVEESSVEEEVLMHVVDEEPIPEPPYVHAEVTQALESLERRNLIAEK